MKSMLDFLQEPDDVSPQQSGPAGFSMLDAFQKLDEQAEFPAAAEQPAPVVQPDIPDSPQTDAAALPGTPYDFGDELDAGMIQPIPADPGPAPQPPSVFNQAPDPRQPIIDAAMEQPGPTQLKADLGIGLDGKPLPFTRDMATAFDYGALNTRANVAGFAADIEEVLRDTAMSSWMQKTQNYLRQPLINPVRKFFGADPLPEDANLAESRAFAERARNSSERLMQQAEALGYRPLTTDKIKNFGDFLDWAQTSLASSGEPMIVAIASGGWMSPLMLGGEFNANLKEIEGLSQADRVALAAGGGTVAAVLENLGLGILIKGLPDELIGKLGGQYFVNWVNKNYGTRVGSAVATSMATEGITEMGQDGIGIGLEAIAGKEFREGEIKSRLREAGLAGAVVGGQVGGTIAAGKETASAIAERFPQDQEASEFDILLAQKVARDLLNPTSAEFGRVDPEQPATETRSPEEQFEARVKAIEDLGTQEAQVLAKGIRGARQTKMADFRGIGNKPGKPPKSEREASQEMLTLLNDPEGFYQQKINEVTARADPEYTPPAIERDGDYFSGYFKSKTELQNLESARSIPSAKAAMDAAQERVNQLAAEINDAGYRVDEVNSSPNIPKEIKAKRRIMSMLGGTASRLSTQAHAVARGHKRANPEKMQATIDEIFTELGQTQAPPSSLMVSVMREAGIDVSQYDANQRPTAPVPAPVQSEPEPEPAPAQTGPLRPAVAQPAPEPAQKTELSPLQKLLPTLDGYSRSQPDPNDPIPTSVLDMIAWVTTPEKAKQLTNQDISLIMRSSTIGGAPQANLDLVINERQERQNDIEQGVPPVTQPAPEPVAQPEPETNPQQIAEPVGVRTADEPKSVQTPDSEARYEVEAVVMELTELKQAQGSLQPRDRTLKESTVEMLRRASPERFNPARLLDSPTTGDGAPIIARDGTIMSGNGRALTLRELYEKHPQSVAAYKQALEAAGVNIEGFSQPVLVRRLTDTDMTIADLSRFADLANTDDKARMSTTEAAQRDAQRLSTETVNLFTGGDLTSTENKPFVDAFVRQVLSPTELGQFTRDGRLTKDAVSRMQAAILATAYQDTDALAIMLDSTDDNIKAISSAMMAAAPKISQLKADIAAGEVKSEFDISQQITDAAKLISDLRSRNIKPRDYYNQQDAFSDADPLVEAIVRSLYNDELTRAKSQKFMRFMLESYVEEASNRKTDALFEDETTPEQVLKAARAKAERAADGSAEGQGSLLPETGISDRNQTGREQVQRKRRKSGGKGLRDVDTADTRQARQEALDDGQISTEEASQAAAEADTRVVKISDIGNQRTALPGTRVSKIKERNKTALMFTAFADAGLDPNIAINLPIERQFKILSDLVKDRFGFKFIEKTDRANSKEAVDQLLTGYHNLSAMANTLGLPYKAVGLGGTLSFIMAKEIGAYGRYDPNTRAIAIPRRVNSFAHEWFHALDHYVYEKFGQNAGENPLASDTSRKEGKDAFKDDAPVGVIESYLALSRAMFKDKATEAQQLAKIEQDMAKMEANASKRGKDVYALKSYKALVAQRKRILEGTGRSPAIKKTNFRTSAEFFAQMAGQGVSYWASPREMFARTGEAFITNKMALDALNADFLGLTQEGYMMTLEQLGVTEVAELTDPANAAIAMDSRLALTFPKDAERMEIFGAMQNLMNALAAETALGEGQVGKMPGDNFVTDIRRMHDVTEQESQGFIKDQIKAFRDRKKYLDRMSQRASEYEKYEKGKIPILNARRRKMMEDGLIGPMFYQKQGVIKSLLKRYPNSKRLKLLMQLLATHTGGKFQSVAEGDNLTNAQTRQVRVFSDRLKQVSIKHDIPGFTKEEIDLLRDILISQDTLDSAPDKVVKAAGDIRTIYNTLYEYLRNAGLDIGYAPSGYVQRLLDHVEINSDPTGFREASQDVYKIIFEKEIGELDTDTIEQMDNLIDFIRASKLGIVQRDEWAAFVNSGSYKKIQDLRREARKDSTSDARKDAIEQEIEEVFAGMGEIYEQFYNDMRNIYSDIRAVNWRTAIMESHAGDPAANSGPSQDFTKKRELPPEADKILEKYYVSDPIENLTTYILGAVRKAEFNRRFGRQRIPKGENKNNQFPDYLEYIYTKLASQDRLLESEVKMLRKSVDNLLGRNLDNYAPNSPGKTANTVAALLSMTLLIRAPISSIAEPFTVALTSKSVKKGMQAWGMTLMEAPGLRKMNKEGIRQRQQFTRILGVIDDPEVGDIIANRIGGDFAGHDKLNKLLSSFFYKIKLSGMTNAQRRSAARIGFQYITEMAYEYRNPITDKAKKQAKAVLNDMGVADSRIEQFVDYILSFNDVKRKNKLRDFALNVEARGKAKIDGKLELPLAEDIMDDGGEFNDMGLQLAVAIMRFTDQSIQDPRTQDRPTQAEHPLGRLVFGITSFIYSFQDKVIKAIGRRTAREYGISRETGQGKASAAGSAALYATATVAGPLLTLFTAHFLVSTAREYLLNQERWNREWEESDEDETKFFASYLLPLALSRAGAYGAFDPIVQAFSSLKYQRDLSNAFLGTAGYVTQNVEDIFSLAVNNSPNTLYSEYRALRGAWNLTAAPAVSLAIANLPLTPASALAVTGVAQVGTSTTARDYIINKILETIYGEKYVKGGKGRTKSSFPDTF